MNQVTKTILTLAMLGGLGLPALAGVVAPGTSISGRTMGEWQAEWWRWGFGFPANMGPLDDTAGALGHLGDVGGPVFFISAPGGTVNYTMTVPGGQYLFFPLLTIVDWLGDGRTEAEVEAEVIRLADGVTGLYATLDGAAIPNLSSYRVLSPWFDFTSPDGGLLPEGTYRAIADGYWLMLEPLPLGQHTLSFGGRLDEFGFAADTNVSFTVTPEPSSIALAATSLAGLIAWRRRRNPVSGSSPNRPATARTSR